ncbi:hypothetical protein EJ04DRAFT_604272, partial [Polyplosphaeria fusca]
LRLFLSTPAPRSETPLSSQLLSLDLIVILREAFSRIRRRRPAPRHRDCPFSPRPCRFPPQYVECVVQCLAHSWIRSPARIWKHFAVASLSTLIISHPSRPSTLLYCEFSITPRGKLAQLMAMGRFGRKMKLVTRRTASPAWACAILRSSPPASGLPVPFTTPFPIHVSSERLRGPHATASARMRLDWTPLLWPNALDPTFGRRRGQSPA